MNIIIIKIWDTHTHSTHTHIHREKEREKFIQINDNYSEAIETSRLSFLLKCHEI